MLSNLLLLTAIAGPPPPRIHVPRVDVPPRIDGVLDDAAWRRAARLEGWVQTQPGDNVTPVGRTIGYLLHDGEALYIAVHAEDEPGAVRYVLHARDVVVEQGQDWIGVMLDTFNDRRRAFGFAVNPIGIQGDGMLLEGGFREWDAVFETAGQVRPDRSGYAIEVRFPFRSLRFRPSAVQVWGFRISRTYGRSGAVDQAWPYDRDLGCELCQLVEIELEGVLPGRNLEINPTLLVRGEAEREEIGQPLGAFAGRVDPGVNLKYGLGANLTLDGTIHPDFSQVESDAGQLEINNRFALFFPEKRPFFLEGGEVFAIAAEPPGGQGFLLPPLNLVHSRRILDPDFGLKLSGKQGPLGLGLLAMRDTAPASFDGAAGESQVAIARARLDVLQDGYVGGLVTARRFQGDADALGAVDARLRFGQNAVLRVIGAAARSDILEDDDAEDDESAERPGAGAALHLQLDWQSRHWAGGLALVDVTPGFRAPLGFVPRPDQVLLTGAWSYIWQGAGFLQRVRPQLRYERIYEHAAGGEMLDAGRLVDELYEPSLWLQLAGATQVTMGYHRAFTFFDDQAFDDMDRYGGFVASQALRWLGLEAFGLLGEDVIFSDEAEDEAARPAWVEAASVSTTLRPTPPLRIGLSLQASRVWRRTEQTRKASLYADALIPRLKAEYQLTRRLGLRVIAQRGTERFFRSAGPLHEREDELAVELLAAYIINAGSAFYLGWTELHEGDATHRRTVDRRGGVAKVSYLWRF